MAAVLIMHVPVLVGFVMVVGVLLASAPSLAPPTLWRRRLVCVLVRMQACSVFLVFMRAP